MIRVQRMVQEVETEQEQRAVQEVEAEQEQRTAQEAEVEQEQRAVREAEVEQEQRAVQKVDLNPVKMIRTRSQRRILIVLRMHLEQERRMINISLI